MTRPTFRIFALLAPVVAATAAIAAAKPSELTVKLELLGGDYIEGERILAIVDVANASPDPIDARGPDSPDHLVLELMRASDHHQYEKVSKTPFVEPLWSLSPSSPARVSGWRRISPTIST